MRILGVIFLVLHAVIHFLGFLKAFKIIELNTLNVAITKVWGVLWLLSSVFFLITTILLMVKNNYWWLFGLASVLVSQIVIIVFWKESKFGTITNIIILIVCILAYFSFSFSEQINKEVSQMLSKSETIQNSLIIKNKIEDLPVSVQKWLGNCGIKNNFNFNNIYLKQEILMKLNPKQKKWYKATALQYFTTGTPAFNWTINMDLNPLIKVVGRDKLENGKGEMLIKIASLLPIVNVQNNEKINQATLQRYLAEIVWFPFVALNPYISWESINENCAKATISDNEKSASGLFFFNKNGEFTKFTTMRYKDINDNKPKEWIIEVVENKVFNNVKIPMKLKVSWNLDSEYFTWLQLKITEIQYNVAHNFRASNN